MRTIKRLGALVAGGLLTASTLVVGGSSAQATPADCATWPNPGSATGIYTQYSQGIGRQNTYVELRVGYINGRQAGWARIVGNSKKGDGVWMDVSKDGGKTWTQCGPFLVTKDGGKPYSMAYYTSSSSSLMFRACGRAFPAYSVCGPWW